ncbi:hypothetical protein FOZ62_026033, partial [Perkinsus olseni]
MVMPQLHQTHSGVTSSPQPVYPMNISGVQQGHPMVVPYPVYPQPMYTSHMPQEGLPVNGSFPYYNTNVPVLNPTGKPSTTSRPATPCPQPVLISPAPNGSPEVMKVSPVVEYKLVPAAPGLNKAIEEADRSKIFDDPWCGSEDPRTFMEFKVSLTSAAPYAAAKFDIQRYALIWVHLEKSLRATLETQRTYRFGPADWSRRPEEVLKEYWVTLEEEYARPSDRARILNRWNALKVKELDYVTFTREFNSLVLHVEAIQGQPLSDEDRRSKIYNAVDEIARCYIDEVLPGNTTGRELNSKLLSHYGRRKLERKALQGLATKENAVTSLSDLNVHIGLNAIEDKVYESRTLTLTGEWSKNPALKVQRGQLYVNYDVLKVLKACFRCFRPGHSSEKCREEAPTFVHLRCHACGKTGHKQADCLWLRRYKVRQDQQRACGRCGKPGHLPGICRNPRLESSGKGNDEASEEPVAADPEESKLHNIMDGGMVDEDLCVMNGNQNVVDEGPLYVTMKFSDGNAGAKAMKVMIDTGAGRSYCRASLVSSLKKSGWQLQTVDLDSPVKVRLANGHPLMVYSTVDVMCSTRWGLKTVTLCILESMTSEIILGMDTLRAINFGVMLSPSRIETKTGVTGYEDHIEDYVPVKSFVDEDETPMPICDERVVERGGYIEVDSSSYMDSLFLGKDMVAYQKKDEKRSRYLKEIGCEDDYDKVLMEYEDLGIIEPVTK